MNAYDDGYQRGLADAMTEMNLALVKQGVTGHAIERIAAQEQRIALLEGLLEDSEQGLRVLKTMLRIEHLPGGAAAAEKLIERIRAALVAK
jgi:hypothetical protein